MPNYESLSPDLAQRIASERNLPGKCYTPQECIRRQNSPSANAVVWNSPFLRDIDSILHCPYYNRYSDKTQVFSLMKNDDITRRSLHVQLVSRIARTIGRALKLDLDLIEAIALGHDIGHPPFATPASLSWMSCTGSTRGFGSATASSPFGSWMWCSP